MPPLDLLSSLQARLRAAPMPVDAAAVRAAELRVILGCEADVDADGGAPWGLALSGGGIRSATFGLGVLQTLARSGLLPAFHYQSTVSGGGYIGAFLQGLVRRGGFAHAFAVLRARLDEHASPPDSPDHDAQDAEAAERLHRPIRHLREYSNYLAPRKSPFSGDTLAIAGTVARNMLLIQLQLCALILVLVLLPLLLHRVLTLGDAMLTPALAALLGLPALALLAYVTRSADRRPPTDADTEEAPPPWIALAATATIALLAGAAFFGSLGVARYEALPPLFDAAFEALRPSLPPVARLAWTGGALYFAAWMLWLLFDRALPDDASSPRVDGERSRPPLQRHVLRFVLATLAASALAGGAIAIAHALLHGGWLWHAFVFGPLLVFVAFALTGIVHLGLAGPALSDLQREIWARVGGRTAAVVLFGMTLPLGLTLYGPWLLAHLFHFGNALLAGFGWASVLAWLSTTALGLLAARADADAAASQTRSRRALAAIVRIAPWVFILGLILLLSYAGQALLQAIDWSARPLPDASSSIAASLQKYFAWLDDNIAAHPDSLPLLIAAAFGIWLLFGWAVDVNEFSFNAFYRNRLVRCYLGASNEARNPEPITNFDVDDDLVLADLVQVQRCDGTHAQDVRWPGTRPPATRPLFPLIGTALNLVAAKQLDWQDRKAASFVLTPGYCGYLPPSSRADAPAVGDVRADIGGTAAIHAAAAHDGASTAAALTLGSAIAISGAAINPNMGKYSSPALTFLLTLFDARSGWWLPNLSHPLPPRRDGTPFFGGWLLAELLGRTHEGSRYVHLSDGGHFENLGLYELVRRRCRFVLCVDAGVDPQAAFADLGNAVLKCRVDFGVDIVVDVSALRPGTDGRSQQSCAVGRIDYPDGESGTLLYVRPALTGAEPADVRHYAQAHPRFPHEPVSDQYFDEAQFESYRRLGEDVMARALAPVLDVLDDDARRDGLGLRDAQRKAALLDALVRHWAPVQDGADPLL
jgi:hypothetical protein